jgi:hypothetical protein
MNCAPAVQIARRMSGIRSKFQRRIFVRDFRAIA